MILVLRGLVYKCLHLFIIYLFSINLSFWCFASSQITCALYDNSYSLEFDNSERPECNNLVSIYQLISGKTKEVRNAIFYMCVYVYCTYNSTWYPFLYAGSCAGMPKHELGHIQTSFNRCLDWSFASHSGFTH